MNTQCTSCRGGSRNSGKGGGGGSKIKFMMGVGMGGGVSHPWRFLSFSIYLA